MGLFKLGASNIIIGLKSN